MKNKIIVLGLASIVMFSGCQMIGEKIAQKAIESASDGKVKLDTSGGTLKVKNEDGSEVSLESNGKDGIVVKDGKGNEGVFTGGNERPANAPSDLPSLNGAKGFSWIGDNTGTGNLTFMVGEGKLEDVCKNEMALLAGQGWSMDDKYEYTTAVSIVKSMKKEGALLSVSCSAVDSGVAVNLLKAMDTGLN